ncbi:unnamed protein product [Pseudo-nitzschia multistriata]|uniref:Uncharacterized protein n=1 Tax=Pseudo-nitzschia multistriata TaxID=183589 RepID=A0A448Z6Y4_9STRA|nr:unnamed protein product [Pseudo-nitzschia multistriata]
MEFADGDIAKHIWGFFLHFDETAPEGPTAATNSITPLVQTDCKRQKQECCALISPSRSSSSGLDRRLDFRSIRSLRSVNRFFRNTFDEFCGWSRCALAMKREYLYLESRKSFEYNKYSWNLRQQGPSAPGWSSATVTNSNGEGVWTREKRLEAARMVSLAMEQKKAAVLRRNHILWLLDRGPFTIEEKRLTSTQLCTV